MNSLILAATILLGGYQPEDFHYYDDELHSHGAVMVNKLYVDISSADDKKKFIKSIEKMGGVERFKEIENDRLNGLLLFFKTKAETFAALNKLEGKPVYPVIMYEGFECSAINEILIRVQPNVSKEDLIKRLTDETKADYKVIKDVGPGLYVVQVDNLKYPSNMLVLANLIAKDSFWVKTAVIAWVPLADPVKATLSVETEANSHLGELRVLKLTIDVMNPEVSVRKDLLPQFGQTLVPFPNPGELWLDSLPQEIEEVQNGHRKTIIVKYPFRELNFGNFVIQPVIVSFEHHNKLRTTKSNLCQFGIKSVIEGTEIEDIQARNFPYLHINEIRPFKEPWTLEAEDIFMNSAKFPVLTFLGGLTVLMLSLVYMDFANRKKRKPDHKVELWSELAGSTGTVHEDWKKEYLLIASRLNRVLNACWGVSLYSLDLNKCNDNFKMLTQELNRVFRENESNPNVELLRKTLSRFCFERKYD